MRIIIYLIISFFVVNLTAQEATKPPNIKLNNPHSAVLNHLENLQSDNYKPEIAALSMHVDFEIDERIEAAVLLKQYLDAKGLYVNLDRIPKNENYQDSTKATFYYKLFKSEEDIYLVRKNSKWMYSQYTTDNISRLHAKIYPLGSHFILRLFPTSSSNSFLGLFLWQWLGLLSLIIFAIIFYYILKKLTHFIIKGIIQKKLGISERTSRIIIRLENGIAVLLIIKLLQLYMPALILPIQLSRYIALFLSIFFTVFVVVLAVRLAGLLMEYLKIAASKTSSTLDDQLIPVLSKLLKSVIVLVGVFYVLKLLDVNITALIAGISIGGLAIALAAQDTVKNLIGSVMIFFDKPFQIGDAINFDGKDGIVEEVGMRSTRVRAFDNSVIYIPNGKLADSIVNNLGLRKFRRYKTDICITYDTPPVLIDIFVDGIREIIANHPLTFKENFHVYLNSFGDSSLNILVYAFFDVRDYKDELTGRHEIMHAIINLASILGINFAFPTQTLHVENFPGQVGLSPTYSKNREELKTKLDTFIDKYKTDLKKDQ
ncbi:MAG: mechanosensitive ion channel family protein [Chitinophagales bacterium]|nr:mechanosensitive ion channel family protein [Chitinophagales bacterium]